MEEDFARLVPDENVQVYKYLYLIETALREFLIDCMTSSGDPKEYKSYFPDGTILEAYKRGREYEKETPWLQYVPSHPVYFLEFPQLRETYEARSNWPRTLGKLCGRKEVVTGSLRKLEPIRNRIAHNRKATAEDVLLTKSVLCELSTIIGPSSFHALLSRRQSALSIPSTLLELKSEADSAHASLWKYQNPPSLTVWSKVEMSWWFDQEYLGHSIDAISRFFSLVDQYSKLERERGDGHIIHRWLVQNDAEDKYAACASSLSSLREG